MESRRDHALLYDDDCGFCKLCVRTMLRLDDGERLNPVAIQSDEGKRLLTEVPEELHLESFHLVTPGGQGPVGRGGRGAARQAPARRIDSLAGVPEVPEADGERLSLGGGEPLDLGSPRPALARADRARGSG